MPPRRSNATRKTSSPKRRLSGGKGSSGAMVWVGETADIRPSKDGPLIGWATNNDAIWGDFLPFKENAMQRDPRGKRKSSPKKRMSSKRMSSKRKSSPKKRKSSPKKRKSPPKKRMASRKSSPKKRMASRKSSPKRRSSPKRKSSKRKLSLTQFMDMRSRKVVSVDRSKIKVKGYVGKKNKAGKCRTSYQAIGIGGDGKKVFKFVNEADARTLGYKNC